MKTIILAAVTILCTQYGCVHRDTSAQMREDNVVSIATERARSLGYDVDNMSVQSKKNGEVYQVVLFPKDGRLGGDISLTVNADNGKILSVKRGQ